MKKSNKVVNKNAKQLSKTLGLSSLDAIEWEVRFMITRKIIETAMNSNLNITDIAKIAGTSRARITKILKDENLGISLDVLIRVLGALGEEVRISFRKAA